MSVSLLDRGTPVTDAEFSVLVAGALPRPLPGVLEVGAAAARLEDLAGLRIFTSDELMRTLGTARGKDRGDYYAVSVSPGRVKVRTVHMSGHIASTPPRGVIWEWSARSRARLHETIADLDLTPLQKLDGNIGMVTLTLPDAWETIAPTAQEWARAVERLRLFWRFETDLPWVGVWKKEFQKRGAPHLHAMMNVPDTVQVYRRLGRGQHGPMNRVPVPMVEWLADAWVRACKTEKLLGKVEAGKQLRAHLPAPKPHLGEHGGRACKRVKCRPRGCIDESAKMTDPRRMGVYFGKHSAKTGDAKEYQHSVPEAWRVCVEGHPMRSACGHEPASVGRFWGVWGLRKAVRECLVTSYDFDRLARILRRVRASRHARQELQLLRACGLRVSRSRLSRAPQKSLTAGVGGFVLVNDGPALAFSLARALALMDE